MINAFTTQTDLSLFDKKTYKKITVAAHRKEDIVNSNNLNIEFYQLADSTAISLTHNKICLASMLDEDGGINDKIIDKVTEYVLTNNAGFMAVASRTLYEVGLYDAKYKLSPIMLLHKLGLLENAKIVGGVYLDNDDIDLMVQQNTTLVLTPSFDSGNGNGIPNAVSYLKRGLKIMLGTGDNFFNKSGDINFEATLLLHLVNGAMNDPNAVTNQIIERIKTGG